MRLIDADQFGVIALQGKSEDFIDGVLFMFDKIHEAPTLPNPCGKPCAFERPYGEWIFDSNFTAFRNPYGTYKCSACGCHSSNKYSFCKDCGADMRGKHE